MNQLTQHHQRLHNRLKRRYESAQQTKPYLISGKLTQMIGLTLEATGCSAPVGSRCLIQDYQNHFISAEVVGFNKEKTYLMPLGATDGLTQRARVIPSMQIAKVAVGDCLLGRVLDAEGNPLDDKDPIKADDYYSLLSKPLNPLKRAMIAQPLDVGIRSINALLTVGQGQRLGLFAGSGVGKSVLLGMMTRFTAADVIVVGLIGERGREVKEFIETNLGQEGLARRFMLPHGTLNVA